MRRPVLTLAALCAFSLGACSSGSEVATPQSSSSAAPSSSRTTTSSTTKSSPAPKPTPTNSDVTSSSTAMSTTSATVDAAPEVVSEDGGIPGGGLADEEFSTTGYLQDMWTMAEAADDGSAGMMCLIFRSEPDAEFGLGEKALLDSIDDEVEGIDREEARKFFDKKCPTAAEIEAASNSGDQ